MIQASLFDDGLPGVPVPRGPLTRDEAAWLYAQGLSACQIRAMYPQMTVSGVEARIRAGGRGGLAWCPLHRRHEALSLSDGTP